MERKHRIILAAAAAALLLLCGRLSVAGDANLRAAASRRNLLSPLSFADPKSVSDKPSPDFELQLQAQAPRARQYIPSRCERFVAEHAENLGYASKRATGCNIWLDPGLTRGECDLASYVDGLEGYAAAVEAFQPIPDVLDSIRAGDYGACSLARPHPEGLGAFFGDQLSLSDSGLVEPLLPPQRSHKICFDLGLPTRKEKKQHMLELDYIVHDFEAMCHKLRPHSRRVLIDMGASLTFHSETVPPIVSLLNLYEKFGFHFDYIYGFEATFTDPKDVWNKLIPEKYLPNYHWINEAVTAEEGGRMNPLHSILSRFHEDDFVVVKLDIDYYPVEVPLANQLLDGGQDGIYHRLVDQFYFEHHVHMAEVWKGWKGKHGTIKDTIDLFSGLRERGIPAHYWI